MIKINHYSNPTAAAPNNKNQKECLDQYCTTCFCPPKIAAQKMNSHICVKKITFRFMARSKKCNWAKLAKMGQKHIISYNGHFFDWYIRSRIIFLWKNHFWFSWFVKTNSDLAENEFLADFYQFGPVTFFWPGHKTKSDFFHIRMTFVFLSGHFWWSEKCAIVMTQTLFLIFVIRGCHRWI